MTLIEERAFLLRLSRQISKENTELTKSIMRLHEHQSVNNDMQHSVRDRIKQIDRVLDNDLKKKK